MSLVLSDVLYERRRALCIGDIADTGICSGNENDLDETSGRFMEYDEAAAYGIKTSFSDDRNDTAPVCYNTKRIKVCSNLKLN